MPMTGRMLLRLSPIAAVLALAACGGGGETTVTVTTTSTTTTPAETTSLRVYFLKDGKVQPVAREVPKTQAVAGAALRALLRGPSKVEQQLGITSDMPDSGHVVLESLSGGVARLTTSDLSKFAQAQVVYTLTQFPTVKAVEVNGKRYTRADFEDETPIILVESPLPFEHVKSPLRATGTANTFEATFNYDVVDADGKVVATHFVTATSGTGTRGTFDFTAPFTVDRSGLGKLKVYELSAANGSRIHQSEIPIYLEQ
jgi:Immunoglobulin-like domain of bacterial spore germination/Sporulation and spore germination